MSKETSVFLFGIVLILVPFLGLPQEWRQYLIASIGAIMVLVGYSLRRRLFLHRIDMGNGERGTDSFVETTEKLFDERTIE